MHRRNLSEQIDVYARRHPHEIDVVSRFRTLLQNHADCFERTCWAGHITGSAWLVDPGGTSLLLTHHKKLDMWLQVGGHSDGQADTKLVAIREAEEESGLVVRLLDARIFDLDVHEIPARGTDPAHYHFDVRYQLQAQSADFVVSDESHALSWVPIAELEEATDEASILRMRKKWLSERAQQY